ncbi:5-(carboxyamino)imidazole ribonucleotide synthase [Halobacterium sp. PCN9]|uniref:N5-carboxyaminoimidazole ribonucleotide synthase n=1 Tax=Halobacterium bonnevillei TaxID=2692200 RepID=A0A6B0SMP4_9EURY|nr:5-(carboxyamino)imidazole ribonucleotide synthase [Halobacterium bonnevillei]
MTLPVPGATIGVVGGGQLGRMLAEAASPLGVDVVVLDPTPDAPACPPAADQLVAGFDDEDAISDLAERADVLTYEIELADPDVLESVGADAGVPVHPSPDTLRTIQDKLVQNRAFADAGVPVPDFRAVDGEADLEAAFDDLGQPLMLKARTGGYDGRGNAPVESAADARETFGDLDGYVAEELVDFERELSVIAVSGDGDAATFPVTENVHEAEILRESVVPARTSDEVRKRATEVATDVLEALDGRGVFGIELFERASPRDADGSTGRSPGDGDGRVLVNEVAPRPHNSGHYTIEGCHASQFEQHVRALCGLPLGDTTLRAPTVMANVLGDPDAETRPAVLDGVPSALRDDRISLHWYGKREVRPLRKMGHVTAVGDNRGELLLRARAARDALSFRESTDDHDQPDSTQP